MFVACDKGQHDHSAKCHLKIGYAFALQIYVVYFCSTNSSKLVFQTKLNLKIELQKSDEGFVLWISWETPLIAKLLRWNWKSQECWNQQAAHNFTSNPLQITFNFGTFQFQWAFKLDQIFRNGMLQILPKCFTPWFAIAIRNWSESCLSVVKKAGFSLGQCNFSSTFIPS